jgi:ELWxxDGT repeat protein
VRRAGAIEGRTAAARGSVLARFVLGALLAAGVGSAQQRPPIEPVRFSVAHRVRDIEAEQERFPFSMTTPSRLGDRSVAWIQTGYLSFDMPFLWSIDNRSGRASLLKEISPLYSPLYVPQPFLRLGERLYFTAYKQGSYGPGPIVLYLWSTDGTPGGTLPVSSSEGYGFEYPATPTLFGGSLYFFASAGASDFKLWKTDGTAMGTVAMRGVRGIPPDFVGFEGYTAVGIFQPPLTVIGGKPLFFALSDRDPARPYALYKLNEASSDATFLLDFARIPGPMVEMGGVGYFSGTDTFARGEELWRTDGTPEGTRIVKDINPGGGDSHPDSLTVAGETLYFSANDGVHGPELWKSDGTETGTVLVKDIRGGMFGQPPGNFVAANGQIFFLADDGVHGEELWRTDGTPEGTRLVKDVRPGSDGSNPAGLVPFGPWLLFSADDGAYGQELWRTDGTEAGTVMIADVAPGSAASTPRTMTAYENAVYFSADDSLHGRELWRTDGTPAGTSLAADLLPGAEGSDPFVVAGPLSSLSVLAVDSGGLSLRELASPTGEFARLASLGSGTRSVSSNPSALTDVGGRLCFFTNSGGYAEISRLWSSDGTEAGTNLLATVQPTSTVDGTEPNAVAPISLGGSLYFVGFTEGGSVNDRFYRFDLDTRNLEPLTDTYPFGRAIIGQTLYFTINFSELWKTDAASRDVVLVKKFDGSPVSLVASGGVLYLSVAGASPGLWKSDGSESGTVPVWSGFAPRLADAAGSLYFTSDDYSSRLASLWVIAPGASSATILQTFPMDQYGDPSSDLTGAGSSLFFLVRDSTGNPRLWKSDGTSGGTYRLGDVAAEPGSLRSDGSRAYFVAAEEQHGRELWTSDGTPQGTVLVKDINPGCADAAPSSPAVIDGILLFSADDGVHGRELWRSDGTADGTYLLDDICPDVCSSSPRGFAKSGPRIFFAADDGETGSELWAMPASAIQSLPGRKPRAPIAPRR